MADHLTEAGPRVPLGTVGNETLWTQNFTNTTISLVFEEKRRRSRCGCPSRSKKSTSRWTYILLQT